MTTYQLFTSSRKRDRSLLGLGPSSCRAKSVSHVEAWPAPDGNELPATAHVFGNAVGEAIPRRLSNTWWNAALKGAQIVDLHFHDLRHEFGSQLLDAGGELHEVQATLGHTNIKMTSTYLNVTTQGVKQAFKKLEAKRRRQSIKVVRGPQMAEFDPEQ